MAQTDQSRGSPRRRRAAALAAVALLGIGFVALRLAAIRQVAFNWDELALLDRVAASVESGVLQTGGRPGLSELILSPLVAGCTDEIAVARHARLLWLGIVLAGLAGIAALLLELLRERRERVHDAALGVALLAALPVFLEWSLQVRTDQLALAGGAWGGAFLLASQRRPALALAAGLAFGSGWLSSQKLVYLAALMGALALGRLALAREWRPRRELTRGALLGVGFGLAWLSFQMVARAYFQVPEGHRSMQVVDAKLVEASLDVFTFYRNTIGYSQYLDLLPTLVPHALLLAALAVASATARRRGEAWLAWAVLALGAAVGAFHAAAFSYFWMTLGLFPAVALALGVDPVRRGLRDAAPAALRPAGATLWLAIALPAVLAMGFQLRDSQGVQRESLAFVHRNFAPEEAGFHPEGGVFCGGSQPLGTWFSQTIYRRFAGERRAENAAALVERFRSERVRYLVQSFRLNQFPPEVRRFWAANYQPYREAVFVAGRALSGARGEIHEFEIVAPGRYRWLAGDGRVAIDGVELAPGAVLELDAGPHRARLLDPVEHGLLVLAVDDAPGPAPRPFYKVY